MEENESNNTLTTGDIRSDNESTLDSQGIFNLQDLYLTLDSKYFRTSIVFKF